MKVVGLAPKVEEILKVTQLYQVFPRIPRRSLRAGKFSRRIRKKSPISHNRGFSQYSILLSARLPNMCDPSSIVSS